ncbi:MAG: cellulase family glycosylhydrolase [Bacilli bacterium]|nr:cellulase family glycosylhydrolase [Bacilli bacterium]
MEPYQIILLSLGGFLVLALLVLLLVYLVASSRTPARKDPERVENQTGFMKAQGRSLYDGEGKRVVLKGVNLGDWFVQEPWMSVSSIDGSFENMFGYTQRKAIAAFKQNPNLDDAKAEKLKQVYLDSFIQEDDFKEIKSLGLNVMRINFTCYNLTLDGYSINPKAFEKIDWAIAMAAKYGLSVILDYHGAIGSQNSDNHSGDDNHFELYGNPKNEEATIEIWRFIANRYKDNKTVAIYDLLNEPRRAVGKFAGKAQFGFYDKLYRAMRAIDPNHIIMMECFTFPFHGVNPRKYGWENIAYSYHIYNLTPFSEGFAIRFYRAFDNLLSYRVPIVIGEFSCWDKEKDWHTALDLFDQSGWSHLAWTYKANRYYFSRNPGKQFPFRLWGFYECDIEPVDIGKASFEEIEAAYLKTKTELCQRTSIYDIYAKRNGK